MHQVRHSVTSRAVMASVLVVAAVIVVTRCATSGDLSDGPVFVRTDSTPARTTPWIAVSANSVEASPATWAPEPPSTVPRSDTRVSPDVLLLGDSSMSAIRWYASAEAALVPSSRFVLDVESCRRVVQPSCSGREQRQPSTVLESLTARAARGQIVVVMAGYNDDSGGADADFATVAAAAQQIGVARLVWLTLVSSSDPMLAVQYEATNGALRRVSSTVPNLEVADWAGFVAADPAITSAWFEVDGVHLTRRGAEALAGYLSHVAATVAGGPCPGALDGACRVPVDPTTLHVGPADEGSEVRCLEVGHDRHEECRPVGS